MLRRIATVALLVALFGCGNCAAVELPRVRIATSLGDIEVAIDSAHAPLTAANFLKYVDAKYYDAGVFHRTVTPDNQPGKQVKIEVIQGGVDAARGLKDFPAIALERTSTTGLKHLAGTISMARDRADSATSDFFICLTDQPSLDFGGARHPDGQGFAAFGQVTAGMEVVRRIQHSRATGQSLTPPVAIRSIRRIAGAAPR